MRLIAFITEGTQADKILDHIGVDTEPPHLSPARRRHPTHPSQRYGFCSRRFFMVNLPHWRKIQGSLGVRSLLLRFMGHPLLHY